MARPLFALTPVVLGAALGSAVPTWAAPPETAPAALTQLLSDIETASNQQSLEAVMGYYAENFTSADGFTRDSLASTLEAFWQTYADLTYEVELLDWEATADGYVIETLTTVSGTQELPSRELALTAELRSQQRLTSNQIVYQEILSETSRLESGQQPPTLNVLLPEQLSPGAEYSFDAIVVEPLEGRALLGAALDEGVTATDFLAPRPLTLELLTAGGLFKLGQASEQPDSRWVSAILIREDGLVVETRRLRIGTNDSEP